MTAKAVALPVGPRMPAIFQLGNWIMRPCAFLEDCLRRYGDNFIIEFPIRGKYFFISDPQAIQKVFTGSPAQFFAGQANAVLSPVLGENSLLVIDDEKHSRERRLMLPPFHGERMRYYGEVIRDITEQVTAKWPQNKVFAIHPSMQELSLDVIIRAVFGIHGERFLLAKKLLLEQMSFAGRLSAVGLFIPFFQRDLGPFTPWRRFVQVRQKVDNFIFDEIRERRQQQDPSRKDILSMLLEAEYEDGEKMNEQQLRDELITLLLAGHETTATALAWGIYWIYNSPEILAELRKELAACDSLDDITRNKYLDAVCKEILRVAHVVPVVARILQQPGNVAGYDLPAGMGVVPCAYLLHRREELYPEPNIFRPQRFLEKTFKPYEYMPFGGGARRCIGAAFAQYEMKIALATIVPKFSISIAEKRSVRLVRRGVILAPAGGIRITTRHL